MTAKDPEWSATATRGLDYWRLLAAVLQQEPVRTIDRHWTAMLLPIAITQGQALRAR